MSMRQLAVGGWTALIFATVPLANRIQATVADAVGRQAFAVVVVVLTMAATWVALLRARQRAVLSPIRTVVLLTIAVALIAATVSLHEAPEEAIHFIEYGVLGALAHRAFIERSPNALVYPKAVMFCAVVALADEALQWMMPGRYWELRDVAINLSAASLVQAAIAVTMGAGHRLGAIDARSARSFVRMTALAIALLALSMLNTPDRIAGYTTRWPSLAFLADADGAMFEYGYYYEDPETGNFKSRLSPSELRRADEQRGKEVGAILDRFASPKEYADVLRLYSPVTDPFVHEVRVHLFRRDRYLERAADYPAGSHDRARCATIAYSEHRILERYFGNTVAHSTFVLADERLRELEDQLLPRADRARAIADSESAVSRNLVTSVTETQVFVLFALSAVVLFVADRRLTKMKR